MACGSSARNVFPRTRAQPEPQADATAQEGRGQTDSSPLPLGYGTHRSTRRAKKRTQPLWSPLSHGLYRNGPSFSGTETVEPNVPESNLYVFIRVVYSSLCALASAAMRSFRTFLYRASLSAFAVASTASRSDRRASSTGLENGFGSSKALTAAGAARRGRKAALRLRVR